MVLLDRCFRLQLLTRVANGMSTLTDAELLDRLLPPAQDWPVLVSSADEQQATAAAVPHA